MPPLSQIKDGLTQKQICKALVRLGFYIDYTGGNGSHALAEWPKNGKCLTIPYHMNKHVVRYICKQMEEISDCTWDELRSQL